MHIIRKELESIQNDQLKQFNKKIINTKYNVLGVKTEVLKKIAKDNVINYKDYFKENHIYYEEYMIHGFMLGYLKLTLEGLIPYINDYIELIDNWAMVDSIVSNLKIFNKYEREVFELAKSYLKSDKEFKVRFGYCIFLSYYINKSKEEYIDEILTLCNKNHDLYYIQMMVAWLLSFSYIKFKEKTFSFLLYSNLDNFTFNKTISKICDSYRVTKEEKEKLKKLRKAYE